jgi:hypothetical protein
MLIPQEFSFFHGVRRIHGLHRPPSATAPRARCKVRHRTKALLRQQLGDRGDTWYLARLHRACCASALPR